MPPFDLANHSSTPERPARSVAPPAAVDAAPLASVSAVPPKVSGGGWEVEVFFDGDCPLCLREINWLRRRDRQGKIRFTDIAAPSFEATSHGKTQAELMARIHGRLPDGTFIEGVEVFRRLYSAVGLGWLVAPSRLPVARQLLDWGYRIFARNRLKLTGRCTRESCPPSN